MPKPQHLIKAIASHHAHELGEAELSTLSVLGFWSIWKFVSKGKYKSSWNIEKYGDYGNYRNLGDWQATGVGESWNNCLLGGTEGFGESMNYFH